MHMTQHKYWAGFDFLNIRDFRTVVTRGQGTVSDNFGGSAFSSTEFQPTLTMYLIGHVKISTVNGKLRKQQHDNS